MPADEEFGCGMYTWSKVYFDYRKPLPGVSESNGLLYPNENVMQEHLAFITNNYECLCDAFSNPILNVCRQKTIDHFTTTSVYGTSVPGAGMVGPLPSKRMPFPRPWEKHYDIAYEYEQDNYLECQCDVGGAPLMDTCRQRVLPLPPLQPPVTQ